MKFWLWLDHIKGLGPINAKKLLEIYKTPVVIYKCSEAELLLVDGIGPKIAKQILSSRSLIPFQKRVSQLHQNNIKILTYNNRLYPDFVKQDPKSPIVLYYKGILKPIKHTLCITGNQSLTAYSQTILNNLVPELIKHNMTLVSGLTLGAESHAHDLYVRERAYQIAIVPHSLDLCYPRKQTKLMDKITKHGIILSRHAFDVKPIKPFYVLKHDLIANWSKRVLIIETSKHGNGLRIAYSAHDMGKQVLVLPHELNHIYAEGSYDLLAKFGKCYVHLDQLINTTYFIKEHIQLPPNETQEKKIVKELIPKPKEPKPEKIVQEQLQLFDHHSELDLAILKLLKDQPMTIDALAQKTTTSIPGIIDALTMLELNYHISSIPGNKYKYNDH